MALNIDIPFLKKNDSPSAAPAAVKFKRKDINFFEIKKGVQKSSSTDAALLLIPIGIVCIMSAIYGYNYMRLNDLEASFTRADNELKSFDLKTKEPILEKYTLTRDILTTYNSWVSALNNQLRYYKTVKPNTLDDIVKLTGGLVECNDITLRAGVFTLNGTSLNINNISEFQKKCESIEGLEDIFVKTITKETIDKEKSKTGKAYDVYTFVMTANFKSFANENEVTAAATTAASGSPEPTQSPAK